MREIGRGTKIFTAAPVRGLWRLLEDPMEVIELIGSPASRVVAVVRDAGATFLAPIFEDLAAVVCLSGTPLSHIGIVSREFQVPSIVGAVIAGSPKDGSEVEVDCTGHEGVIRLVG